MKLAPRERRFLLLGAAALLAFAAINYVIGPAVSSQMQVRAEYQDKLQTLERYQLVVDGRSRYEKRHGDAEALFTQMKRQLLPGEKLTLASAELQAVLHRFAGESGVTIVSESIHRPKDVEGFTQASVEVTLNADEKKLRDFLYKIESAGRLLTVQKLLVNASFPRPGAELQVTVVVSGYTFAVEEKG